VDVPEREHSVHCTRDDIDMPNVVKHVCMGCVATTVAHMSTKLLCFILSRAVAFIVAVSRPSHKPGVVTKSVKSKQSFSEKFRVL